MGKSQIVFTHGTMILQQYHGDIKSLLFQSKYSLQVLCWYNGLTDCNALSVHRIDGEPYKHWTTIKHYASLLQHPHQIRQSMIQLDFHSLGDLFKQNRWMISWSTRKYMQCPHCKLRTPSGNHGKIYIERAFMVCRLSKISNCCNTVATTPSTTSL